MAGSAGIQRRWTCEELSHGHGWVPDRAGPTLSTTCFPAERKRSEMSDPSRLQGFVPFLFYFIFQTQDPSPHSLQSCSSQWRWLNCHLINPIARFLFIDTTCRSVLERVGGFCPGISIQKKNMSHCSISLRKDAQWLFLLLFGGRDG